MQTSNGGTPLSPSIQQRHSDEASSTQEVHTRQKRPAIKIGKILGYVKDWRVRRGKRRAKEGPPASVGTTPDGETSSHGYNRDEVVEDIDLVRDNDDVDCINSGSSSGSGEWTYSESRSSFGTSVERLGRSLPFSHSKSPSLSPRASPLPLRSRSLPPYHNNSGSGGASNNERSADLSGAQATDKTQAEDLSTVDSEPSSPASSSEIPLSTVLLQLKAKIRASSAANSDGEHRYSSARGRASPATSLPPFGTSSSSSSFSPAGRPRTRKESQLSTLSWHGGHNTPFSTGKKISGDATTSVSSLGHGRWFESKRGSGGNVAGWIGSNTDVSSDPMRPVKPKYGKDPVPVVPTLASQVLPALALESTIPIPMAVPFPTISNLHAFSQDG